MLHVSGGRLPVEVLHLVASAATVGPAAAASESQVSEAAATCIFLYVSETKARETKPVRKIENHG